MRLARRNPSHLTLLFIYFHYLFTERHGYERTSCAPVPRSVYSAALMCVAVQSKGHPAY
jgi:hypothetical protein